jgi:monoamine oxidase
MGPSDPIPDPPPPQLALRSRQAAPIRLFIFSDTKQNLFPSLRNLPDFLLAEFGGVHDVGADTNFMKTTAPPITRRQFLSLAGAAAAGTFLPSLTPLRAARQTPRVLIIGGGIAGLGAAQLLRQHGLHTTIIEARHRLGGRIWTDPSGNDLGASWIHGKSGNPLMALVKATRARTFPFDYDNHWRYGAGGELAETEDRRIDHRFAALEREIAAAQKRAPSSAALAGVVKKFSETRPAAERPGLRYAVNTNITHEYAAGPEHLSLRFFDHGAETRGGDLLLPGGYAGLLGALGSADETHLGHTVKEVLWGEEEVLVITNQRRFAGQAVIVTLPLGVLQAGNVIFRPSLPDTHQQAISRLGFGTLDKLILHFPRVAWPIEPNLFGYVGEGLWEEWVNLLPVTGQTALMGFNAGSLAEKMEQRTDQELTASALGILRKMFGSSLPDPKSVVATRWKRDPFSRGSYSSYAPGSSPQDRANLATPVNPRFLFAGEACSVQHPATVHGALQSGREAAKKLLKTWPT